MGVIPEFLHVLFWDTDPESLDLWNHKKFIIERILEFGDEDAYRWMFRTYSDEEIIATVKSSRNISPKTAVLIANSYDIPREEIACLRNVSLPVPGNY